MSDERELMAERERKAAELRQAGQNPYANGFSPRHVAAEVHAWFAAGNVPTANPLTDEPRAVRFSVAGRIVALRSFGKAAFAKVRDRSGEVQVWVRQDVLGEKTFGLWRAMERGDFIGASGPAVLTKTGERTILAEELRVLTKAVRPLPEKWHGLQDMEIRYRQRYVDLIANPEVREVFRKRTAVVKLLRRFLDERDFLEVETPAMHSVLGGAAARPFRTHHNALDMDLYMRIAPELHLKRLVVGGFDRVYEIGRNFRNEGLSRQHNPEFTMLEFYQAYATHEDLMALTQELFVELGREICGGTVIRYGGVAIDLGAFERIPLKDAIAVASRKGILPAGLERPMLDDDAALLRWVSNSGVLDHKEELAAVLRKCEAHGQRLGALFDYGGELALPPERPVFVVDHPSETSPLSRRSDRDPSIVERFELFIVGREHANAFSELNDPADQRARFRHQVEAKAKGAQETMDYDEDYCRALEYGLPPTAGEGIGVDRLVMLLCDQPSIRDVILFPLMRPE
ncbi:MAG: lysine--tRNA ligase [Deltaproteobacteria bacterium]|nr:lysine--tRNA ligase [Deltaproteobacteria bacterium]